MEKRKRLNRAVLIERKGNGKIPNSQEDSETVNHSTEHTVFDVSNHTF